MEWIPEQNTACSPRSPADLSEQQVTSLGRRGHRHRKVVGLCAKAAPLTIAVALAFSACDEIVQDSKSRGDTNGAESGNWDTAHEHVGVKMKVCGPVVSVGTDQDDTFINVGRDYPDDDRFTIVLWDVGPTDLASHEGEDVCATGVITDFNGVAQIEVRSVRRVSFFAAGSAEKQVAVR